MASKMMITEQKAQRDRATGSIRIKTGIEGGVRRGRKRELCFTFHSSVALCLRRDYKCPAAKVARHLQREGRTKMSEGGAEGNWVHS